jgi:hypothetical protein
MKVKLFGKSFKLREGSMAYNAVYYADVLGYILGTLALTALLAGTAWFGSWVLYSIM